MRREISQDKSLTRSNTPDTLYMPRDHCSLRASLEDVNRYLSESKAPQCRLATDSTEEATPSWSFQCGTGLAISPKDLSL